MSRTLKSADKRHYQSPHWNCCHTEGSPRKPEPLLLQTTYWCKASPLHSHHIHVPSYQSYQPPAMLQKHVAVGGSRCMVFLRNLIPNVSS